MPLFTHEPDPSRFKKRFIVMVIMIVVALMILIGRLYYLQIIHGEEYQILSRDNFVSEHRIRPERGMIYDRNHTLLADNRPSFNLYFTPAFCKPEAFELTVGRLTEYLGLTKTEVDKTRDIYRNARRLERFRPMLVRQDMTWEDLVMIRQHQAVLDGIEVQSETRRQYTKGTQAAHLLGYVSEISKEELEEQQEANQESDDQYQQGDSIGKSGVEKGWESKLRGITGIQHVVVDARGQRVPEKQAKVVLGGESMKRSPVPGANLILSLDARLQALAEERFPGTEGVVVALDPNTGFILAMVSRPVYDPNQISSRASVRWWNDLIADPHKPLLNRAVQQHYAPGSTFKPFTALAGLISGAIAPNTAQPCNGSFQFGDHIFRCWRPGGHGSVVLHRALVQSCDVFFYRTGSKAGLDAIAEVAKSFGLGSISGFESGPEVPGIIPNREWYQHNTQTGFLPGFTISDAIGQGDVNVTPLQMAIAYAAIANGGTVYRPQIVLRVEESDGTVTSSEPEIRFRVAATAEQLRVVADGLAGVVNDPTGTAYWHRPQKVSFLAAGKTGTAQVVSQGADRGKTLPYELRDHAWFISWAPVDRPRIVVAVINEHGGHGSSAAAPLALELITYYLEQLEPGT